MGAGLARDGGVSGAADVEWQTAIAGKPGSHRVRTDLRILHEVIDPEQFPDQENRVKRPRSLLAITRM